jgi:hypothetical protein
MTYENYLENVIKVFSNYKSLGEKAMAQLMPEDYCKILGEGNNSVAMLVQHLAGNMLSRWTDFLTSDGEKEWRSRDAEFEVVLKDKEAVLEKWEEGWACLLNTIGQLTASHLDQKVLIRNEPHTVVEAINRQLSHYPYHVGQIVFIAKILRGKDFRSLSIPPMQSAQFNAEKFSNGQ